MIFGWVICGNESKELTDCHRHITRQQVKSSRKNRLDGRGSLPPNAFHAKNWRNYQLVNILHDNLSNLPLGRLRNAPLQERFPLGMGPRSGFAYSFRCGWRRNPLAGPMASYYCYTGSESCTEILSELLLPAKHLLARWTFTTDDMRPGKTGADYAS